MKILNKSILTLILGFFFCQLNGQNIFDASNSRKYADYLFVSGDFKLATEEYERLLFFFPERNDTLIFRLIKSYRLSGNLFLANQRLNSFYPELNITLRENLFEYLIVQIRMKHFDLIRIQLPEFSMIAPDEKLFFRLSTELFSSDFKAAQNILYDWAGPLPEQVEPYQEILTDYANIRFKKPFVGGALSAILPGLGQVYAGTWKDGIFAMLFTASTAYQSYRGFNKVGIKSTYGWVYGVLGSGFYIGNIYGAAKAANKFNHTKNKEILNRIEKVFTTYYP